MRHASKPSANTLPDSRVRDLLGRWLRERQDLMHRLCNLAEALRRVRGRAGAKPQPELDRFCEVLVDYVSAGHFEVYRELLEQHERSGTEAEAMALYDLILPSTEAALDFNDRYFRGGSAISLERDLSALGQRLASRFDCEDALIRSLGPAARAIA